MECNMACILRWTIYVLAVLTLIMAIATIAIDQSDNSSEKTGAGEGTGQAYTNKTGSNFVLFFLMLATVAFAGCHYFWPRLILIVLLMLFASIFTILRIFMPHKVHFETIFVVPLNGAVSLFYVFWVGFHEKTDKDEGLWRTMTKPEVRGDSSDMHKKSSKMKKKGSKKTLNAA